MYGSGNEPASKWGAVYQRIQAAGKSIQVATGSLRDAQRVARQIKPEGAWFSIWNSYSREEVRGFLDWIERWAAGKEG